MGWGEPDPPARPRLDLGDIIDLVEAGEQYTIERAGAPVAVVLSVADYDALKAAAGVTEVTDG